jgi:hypothetical protein
MLLDTSGPGFARSTAQKASKLWFGSLFALKGLFRLALTPNQSLLSI